MNPRRHLQEEESGTERLKILKDKKKRRFSTAGDQGSGRGGTRGRFMRKEIGKAIASDVDARVALRPANGRLSTLDDTTHPGPLPHINLP